MLHEGTEGFSFKLYLEKVLHVAYHKKNLMYVTTFHLKICRIYLNRPTHEIIENSRGILRTKCRQCDILTM